MQIRDVQRASNLPEAVGCPTPHELKNMIRAAKLRNCPVTVEYVDRAIEIFGKYVSSHQGKTAKSK